MTCSSNSADLPSGALISRTIEMAQRDGKSWDEACELAASALLTQQSPDELSRYRAALERIANFGHANGCSMSSFPVRDCICYGLSEVEIAREALGWTV